MLPIKAEEKPKIIWEPLPGSQMLSLISPAQIILYHGSRGPGKDVSLNTPILTDSGWKLAGEITFNDKLVAKDGSYTNLLGIYPKKNRPLYNIEFQDGHIVEADEEHRWLSLNSKTGYREGWKVRTTKELLKMKTPCSIPYLQGAIPGNKWTGCDPYLLGYLIANGTTGSNRITIYTIDDEILNYCRDKYSWTLHEIENYTARRAVCPASQEKQWRDILGHKISHDKFVPGEILKSDPETRLAVLQGLMDGDGNCESGAKSRYSTVSEQLAKDVTYLVKSLGGWASYSKTIRKEKHNTLGGCGYIYRVNISHHNKFNPFRLKRKSERYVEQTKHLTRGIKSITYSRQGDGVCFAVDHPEHCFICGDFVVTHNTDAQLMRFRRHVGQGFGRHWRGVIFDREYKNLDDLVSKSMRWFPEFGDKCKFLASKSDYKWVWPTGEELLFRAVKKDTDYWSYHGQEFPFIGWNELTKFPTDNLFEQMLSCNRSSFLPDLNDPENPGEIPLLVFATCNPSGCVPYGEVLTADRGWVDIREIKIGENVVSCDKFGNSKISKVTAKTDAPFNGKLVVRKGRGLNMIFTDNHRFAHLNTDRSEHVVKEFFNLPGEAHLRRTASEVAGDNPESLYGFDSGNFMELLGWFISEGCMITRKRDNFEKNSFQIAQNKIDNRNRIENLIISMGLKYRKDKQCFVITNEILADVFRKQGKCREKHIPREFLNLSPVLLKRLHESLMLGDGCGKVYYTISKTLSDDFCELAIRLGVSVFLSTRQRKNRNGVSYEINQGGSKTTVLHTGNHRYNVDTVDNSINVSREPHNGRVYCLTVPETETFYIRQNGCVWLSGNSGHNWVKRRFIKVSPPGAIVKRRVNVFNPRTQKREDVLKTQTHLFGSYKENKYLAPEYIAELESITDPNKKKAWLGGSWDVVAGGMFDDVWTHSVHVISPFEIPPSWKINRSFDYGKSKPFSVGWWAESPGGDVLLPDKTCRRTVKGDLFRIGEWYGCDENKSNKGLNLLASEIAAGIIEREISMGIHMRVVPGPADNAIWSVDDGNCIAVNMARPVMIDGVGFRGVSWTRSDKSPGSRKAGWEKIKKYLKAAIPDITGNRREPGLFVFNTCKSFISTFPVLPRDEDDLDDVDSDAEDHIGDETRYRVLNSYSIVRSGKTKGLGG